MGRSASKSTLLNWHLVLNSVMYFRNISSASDVHDHLIGFLIFPHLSESSGFPSCSQGQLVHHHHLGLFMKWPHCCPPTVPNSVRFGQHRTAKIFPGLTRALCHYRLSWPSDSNPMPQKLTPLEESPYLKCLHDKKLALLGGLPYQADRVTLPQG